MSFTSPLDCLRQPEYTGENRCFPCTLVNSIIALVLAAALALVWPPAGAFALVGSLTAIYLRGYLVPGTPELTQRYFPPWLLELFGKEPLEERLRAATEEVTAGGATETEARSGTEIPADPEGTETLLRSAGVVEGCEAEDDLCLTEEFNAVWWRRIRRLRDDETRAAARLGATIDVDPDALEFNETGGRFAVTYQGNRIGRWPSRAVFYADLAAEPTLAEWVDGWGELSGERRTEVLAGLRVFLHSCPACEADLDQVESVRESCCAGEVVTVTVDCPACGSRVFAGSHA